MDHSANRPSSAMPNARAGTAMRPAFTLVELLVVIAIIGILVALLLPAIQAAREAARRSQCKNQLRQIGLAMQNHASSYRVFPTGGAGVDVAIENYVSGGKPFGPDKQGLNWSFQILPFLEEGAMYGITTQDQLATAVVPIYVCPSRRSPTPLVSIKDNSTTFFPIDYAAAQPCTYHCPGGGVPGCTDNGQYDPKLAVPITVNGYKENQKSFWGGTNGGVGELTTNDNTVYDGVIVRSPWRRTGTDSSGRSIGEFASNVPRPISFSKITDGASHTFVVGEKYLRSDWYQGGSKSDDKGLSDGWDPDAVRSTCFQPYQDSDSTGYSFQPANAPGDLFGADRDVYYFGSAHTGGFNAVYADGSVRTLNYDIDVVVFNALATRAGGETVDESAVN